LPPERRGQLGRPRSPFCGGSPGHGEIVADGHVSGRIADGALQVGDAGDDKIVADGHVSGRIADSALRVGGATYGQKVSSQGG